MGSSSWDLPETRALSGLLAVCEALIPSLPHPFLSAQAASLSNYILLISIVGSHFGTCPDDLQTYR